MLPSAAELVAYFLRMNGYTETLSSFLKEAGLSSEAGQGSSGITIEQILEEKRIFDLSLNFEKLGVAETHGWRTPAPSTPNVVSTSTNSNILSVHICHLSLSAGVEARSCVAVTTADRRLTLYDPSVSSMRELKSYTGFQDSPLLDLIVVDSTHLIAASMSGRLVIVNTITGSLVDERKDHKKYLVKLTHWAGSDSILIASAGWDSKVFFYRIPINHMGEPRLGEPIASITLPTIPETVMFLQAPEHSSPVLLLTRRDSTFLYYYHMEYSSSHFELLGKQNLAPHSNAWVAFSPSDVQLCPTDPTLVAVATSSTPHMKVLMVQLLIPPIPDNRLEIANDQLEDDALDSRPLTQSALARAELLVRDREDAAIKISVNTMAPQSKYSTPTLRWRPDGTGIYVNSDDGIIRGLDMATGKLKASLEGHEAGSKIRCLVAGPRKAGAHTSVSGERIGEYLISGGFDQRLILWTT
ncbi:quinon protein alcohol dehydrogenase-like superfamily [Dendryphion nanum]|uniref:Quinon protein alcohol dehydrogenase-like superfamily n=1 Tax=Dendryphion nanum TaxID=256645 RepID=A0A9P9DXB4_9PLEO|nr:quinon protein alcohol dehydrogenase-like superfamily [Dendryphion nanum]